ncbi:hypothetical protein GOODEAATRI_027955 [Goodea atripinnis]|uniref:Zinc finger piccolo-type domain-containing protein n=1 Tax=Goodea atripinnis TaxID=208336 RepID=A0ABV0P8E8_9TELE
MRSDPYSQRGLGAQGGIGGPTGSPSQQGGPRIPHPGAVPLPGLTKAPSQPDLGRGSAMHQSMTRHHDQTRSAGSSPAHRPQSQAPAQDGLTKLFGFGASLLNQASTLINVDPLPTASTQPSPARAPTEKQQQTGLQKQQMPPQQPLTQHQKEQQTPAPQQKVLQKQEPVSAPVIAPEPEKPKVNCPLCKTELNIGSSDQPNYNTCTQCQSQVCNLCGFNPTPHLVEVRREAHIPLSPTYQYM